MKTFKRILAMFMVLTLMITMLPQTTFANVEQTQNQEGENIEYYYPMGEEMFMLPRWGHGMDRYFDYYNHNEGYGDSCEINDVTTNDEDVVAVRPREDGSGWDLEAVNPGTAEVTLHYTNAKGEADTWTATVYVNNDVFNLDMKNVSSGTEMATIGETFSVELFYRHETYIAEEDRHEDVSYRDEVTYTAGVTDPQLESLLTIKVSGSSVEIEVAKDLALHDTWIPVKFAAEVDGSEVTAREMNLHILDCYSFVEPVNLENYDLSIGESIKITPVLSEMRYDAETNTAVQNDLTADAQFRFDFDDNAVKITNASGNVLNPDQAVTQQEITITKLQNWGTDVWLKADLPDEEGNFNESANTCWHLNEQWYEFYLEDTGRHWIFKGPDGGEVMEQPVVVDGKLDGKSYTILWEMGQYVDDQGTFEVIFDDFDYDYGSKVLLLPANEIWDAYVAAGFADESSWDCWGMLRGRIMMGIGEEQVEVAYIDRELQVKKEHVDYHFPADDYNNDLLCNGMWIDKTFGAWAETKDYPFGEDREIKVISVTASNAADDDGDGAVLQVNPAYEEDNPEVLSGWEIHYNRFGHGIVTIKYETVSGGIGTKNIDVYVSEDVYYLQFSSTYGIDQILPGEQTTVTARLFHNRFTEEDGYFHEEITNATFDWNVDAEGVEILESNASNEVTFKVPANNDFLFMSFPVSVVAKNAQGDELVQSGLHFNVTDRYTHMEPIPTSEQTDSLGVGQTMTYEAVVKEHKYNQETQEFSVFVPDNYRLRVEWDTNAFEVRDKDGNVLEGGNVVAEAPFTFKRLENWGTNIEVIAEMDDGDGYYECCRRSLQFAHLDYDNIFFEGDYLDKEFIRIFSNSGENQEGETYELKLNTDNITVDGYTLRWGISGNVNGEDKELAEGPTTYEIDEETGTVTFHAKGIYEALTADFADEKPGSVWVNINVEVVVGEGDDARVLSGRGIGMEVCEELYGYWDAPSGFGYTLQCWTYMINSTFPGYVQNVENRYGGEIPVAITDVTVQNSDPAMSVAIATVEERPDGGWVVSYNKEGQVDVTIHYVDHNNQPQTSVITLAVQNEFYHVDYTTNTGTYDMLPGASIDVIATPVRYAYDPETGIQVKEPVDGFTFEWICEDGCATVVPDGNVLHITAAEETENAHQIAIELRTTKGDISFSTGYWVYVHNYYNQIITNGPLYAEPGETVDLSAYIMSYGLEYPDGIRIDEAEYTIMDTTLVESDGMEITVATEDVLEEIMAEGQPYPVEEYVTIRADFEDPWGTVLDINTTVTVIICKHEYEVTAHTPQTCTEDGSQTLVCELCGFEKTEVLEATGHEEVIDAAVAATCTSTGLTEGSHCDNCGIVLKAQTVTAKLDHTYELKSTTNATCTADGVKVYKCKYCVAEKTETLKATGHKSVVDAAVAATCTKTGLTEGSHCETCGVILKLQEVVPKTDHKTKETITPAKIDKNGKIVKTCTVCMKEISTTTIKAIKTIKLSKTTYTYNGKVQKPTVTVKDSAGKTIKSTYYTVSYSSGCKNPGSYTVTIKFKGNYSGTKTFTYRIEPKKLSFSSVDEGANSIALKWKKDSTVDGYEIQYATNSKYTTAKKVVINNEKTISKTLTKLDVKQYYVRIRSYKVTKENGKKVTLYSDWSSTKKVVPQPKNTSISKVTGKSKALDVTWKKNSDVTGYEIQYSTSSSFSKKSTKSTTITKNKTTKTTLKKLSAKKNYYVRIRTYKTVKIDGKSTKVYSDWSSAKKVKTK